MDRKYYSSEINHQILLALMKAHNVRKIVASPGTTNINFVGSVQNDNFFEVYSSIDERSASYLACGLAAESGEPVALTCTGATASRNYVPGLTEAFYRKLPVLAITSSQHFGRIGSYIPQVIDRSTPPKDCVKMAVHIPTIRANEHEDVWSATVKINEALLELRHNGGGPVLINIATEYNSKFDAVELPNVQVINRIEHNDPLPEINAHTVGIFVGAHPKWSSDLTNLVDKFCERYNAAVIIDHSSNYKGKYGINAKIVPISPRQGMDLLIHIGEISGSYMDVRPKEVWRVSPDGVIRDMYHKMRYVFEMTETEFFSKYVNTTMGGGNHCKH